MNSNDEYQMWYNKWEKWYQVQMTIALTNIYLNDEYIHCKNNKCDFEQNNCDNNKHVDNE